MFSTRKNKQEKKRLFSQLNESLNDFINGKNARDGVA